MSPWVQSKGRSALLVHLIMPAAYAAAVLVGRATAGTGASVSLIWPAAGVGALWVFMAARKRAGVGVAAILLGTLAAGLNTVTGSGLVLGVVFGAGNAVQAWATLTAYRLLQRRMGRPQWWRMRSVADVTALGAASVVGVCAALPFGPVAIVIDTGRAYPAVAAIWLLRNVVGTLLVMPLALRLLDPRLRPESHFRAAMRTRPREVVAVFAVSIVAYGLIYGLPSPLALSFVPIGLSIWAAARLDTTMAAVHALLVSAMIVGLTIAGLGPFASFEPLDRSVAAQAYVMAYLVFTWLISSQRDELAGLLRDVERSRAEIAQQAELLGTVFATSADAITVFDADGNAVMRNEASMRLFSGIPRTAKVTDGDVLRQFFRLEDGERLPAGDAPLDRVARGESFVGAEVGMEVASTGEQRIISTTATPLPSVAGTEGGAVFVARDVTEERAAQAEVARARDDYAMLLAAATEQAILACSPDGTIRLANKGAEAVLGLPLDSLQGTRLSALHRPEHLEQVAVELGVPANEVHAELARREWSDARRWEMDVPGAEVVSMTVTRTPDGGFLCVASDVTSQVANEQRLRNSEARFRQAFDTAPISMFIIGLEGDDEGVVLETNTTATAFVRRDRDALQGTRFASLVHEDDEVSVLRWLTACAEGRKDHVRTEVRFSPRDASPAWGLISASVVALEDQRGTERSRYLLCLVEDVTARKAAEDALVRQALHDDLTDLPNRVLLYDRLEFALRSIAADPGLHVGILFCDLDGFKDVNDAYGHSTGDEVLREVARRFSRTAGAHDTVARLGGDEFAVISPDLTSEEPLASLAKRLLDALHDPIVSTRGTHMLGVSIGMVMGDRSARVEDLLAQADAAMYEAKRAGKNRVHAYDSSLLAKSVRATRLMPELTKALANGEFIVFGQPVVSLRTGAVESLEMLLRWESPTRGLVAPGEFLDVLESSALMIPVGTHVLRESCRIAAAWPCAADGQPPSVHVNVSGRQLAAGGFTEAVSAALEETGLDPQRLILELTETHMPQLTLPLLSDLATLRDSGVRIALDDLGTGYSSLARLTELPIDVLKIDRAFVYGMGSDDRCDAVVRAVVGMGDAMGVAVVAEGVERPDQAAELARLGCAYAQGFLYSRPQPESELAELVVTSYNALTGEPAHEHAA